MLHTGFYQGTLYEGNLGFGDKRNFLRSHSKRGCLSCLHLMCLCGRRGGIHECVYSGIRVPIAASDSQRTLVGRMVGDT